jgi:hypothetical protein
MKMIKTRHGEAQVLCMAENEHGQMEIILELIE